MAQMEDVGHVVRIFPAFGKNAAECHVFVEGEQRFIDLVENAGRGNGGDGVRIESRRPSVRAVLEDLTAVCQRTGAESQTEHQSHHQSQQFLHGVVLLK